MIRLNVNFIDIKFFITFNYTQLEIFRVELVSWIGHKNQMRKLKWIEGAINNNTPSISMKMHSKYIEWNLVKSEWTVKIKRGISL